MTLNPFIVSGGSCALCYHVQARSGFKTLSSSECLLFTVLSGNRDDTGIVFLQLMDLFKVSAQKGFMCMYTHVCNAAWTRQCLSGCWRGWRNHPLHLFSSPQQTSEFWKWTWWDEFFFRKKRVRAQKWAILFILNKMMCDDQNKINEPSELLLASSQLLQGILLLSDEPHICPVNPVYHSCWLFLAFIFH